MYYIYILESQKDKKFYTGVTADLKERFRQHQHGEGQSTKNRRPFKLIYYEAYLLREDAEARERYLKTTMGKRVIRKQLTNYLRKMATQE